MSVLPRRIRKAINLFKLCNSIAKDPFFASAKQKNDLEANSEIKRFDIINFLLSQKAKDARYLEIGVCNPENCFNKINCKNKISVDPGLEYEENPVAYPITSDEFFKQIHSGAILDLEIKFDVIFIDGLHLAEQVDKDIKNSLDFLKDDGFIVLHDCNPPSEFHSREAFRFINSPAKMNWNGTVWKSFFKNRFNTSTTSCCVDTDWGIGVISKKDLFSRLEDNFNPFFEFAVFDQNRKESLNLVDFETFKDIILA